MGWWNVKNKRLTSLSDDVERVFSGSLSVVLFQWFSFSVTMRIRYQWRMFSCTIKWRNAPEVSAACCSNNIRTSGSTYLVFLNGICVPRSRGLSCIEWSRKINLKNASSTINLSISYDYLFFLRGARPNWDHKYLKIYSGNEICLARDLLDSILHSQPPLVCTFIQQGY